MIGLYIHIPFCEQKCFYCDFFSSIQKSENFYMFLIEELNLYKNENLFIDTVYFGGGTPSLLPANQIESILSFIRKNFFLASDAEITLEANPESLTKDRVRAYKTMGINRISLGVQTLNDKILSYIGRLSDSKKIFQAIESLQAENFKNINFDLIFGLPFQKTQDFLKDIKTLIQFFPTHFSLYNLILHENQALTLKIQKEDIKLEDGVEMYEESRLYLKKEGYNHYEISNFSKKDFQSRHNLHYWNYDAFLGIGPSSSGFLASERYKNYSNLALYKEKLQNQAFPIEKKEILDKQTQQNEFIMMNLRKTQGLSLEAFQQRFKSDFINIFQNEILELEGQSLVNIKNGYFFINPKGYFISNSIIEKFFR